MMRESKWYTDFPFIAVKTRKRGALLKRFHFSERCPVEQPVLLVSRRKKKTVFPYKWKPIALKSEKKSEGYSAQATTVLKSDLLFSFFEIFHCGQ